VSTIHGEVQTGFFKGKQVDTSTDEDWSWASVDGVDDNGSGYPLERTDTIRDLQKEQRADLLKPANKGLIVLNQILRYYVTNMKADGTPAARPPKVEDADVVKFSGFLIRIETKNDKSPERYAWLLVQRTPEDHRGAKAGLLADKIGDEKKIAV
jgi:hypothetical protein